MTSETPQPPKLSIDGMSLMKTLPELWAALSRCRSVRLDFREAREGRSGFTTIVTQDGTSHRPWTRPSTRASLTVRLRGRDWTSVRRVQRMNESAESCLWRALAELSARESQGMPKPDAKAQRRRRLRKMLDNADTTRPM